MRNDIYNRNPDDPNYAENILEMDDTLDMFKQQIESCLFTPKTTVMGSINFGASLDEYIWSYQTSAYDLNYVIFRYFNVAGADPEGSVGEFHQPETHLIPLILDGIDGKRDALTIFGTDYDTSDGTCIRDYVHVCDLVDAHVLGLKWLQSGRGSRVFNRKT